MHFRYVSAWAGFAQGWREGDSGRDRKWSTLVPVVIL